MGQRQLPPRYRAVRLLGRGASADVWLAEDLELGREVAVKLLGGRGAEDPTTAERFAREARVAARLGRHAHVATIFELGRWRGRPFIAMEYCSGGSLDARLEPGRVAPEQAVTWLVEAASALDAAHAEGVVHRDLKPGNLLLDEWGHVRVADFGIARAQTAAPLTESGTILGTAGYLAPEQARGERATPASDRYALGVVAFELLTGRRPFERPTPLAEAAAHAHDPVPAATALRPQLPRAVDAALGRALAKDPAERHGSAAELVADLERALRERPAAPAQTLVLHRHRTPGRARRLGRRVAGSAVVVALTGAAVLGYLHADLGGAVAATCTFSHSAHDANVVAYGLDAVSFCEDESAKLGDSWEFRRGRSLRVPDSGDPSKLDVVCHVAGSSLRVTVWDDGGRRIGQDLCATFRDTGLAVAHGVVG